VENAKINYIKINKLYTHLLDYARFWGLVILSPRPFFALFQGNLRESGEIQKL